MKSINQEKLRQAKKELRGKCKNYEDGYSQIQKLLEAMQKDNESWERKLVIMETKANELISKEESLMTYLEDVIRYKQELDGEVSDLKDELVLIYGTYFVCVKEYVSLFYPQLNLGMLDVLKLSTIISWWMRMRCLHQSMKDLPMRYELRRVIAMKLRWKVVIVLFISRRRYLWKRHPRKMSLY